MEIFKAQGHSGHLGVPKCMDPSGCRDHLAIPRTNGDSTVHGLREVSGLLLVHSGLQDTWDPTRDIVA